MKYPMKTRGMHYHPSQKVFYYMEAASVVSLVVRRNVAGCCQSRWIITDGLGNDLGCLIPDHYRDCFLGTYHKVSCWDGSKWAVREVGKKFPEWIADNPWAIRISVLSGAEPEEVYQKIAEWDTVPYSTDCLSCGECWG